MMADADSIHPVAEAALSDGERQGNQVEGDVVFAHETRAYARSSHYGGPKRRRVTIPVGFLGIANPREVERLLLNQLQERGRQQNAW